MRRFLFLPLLDFLSDICSNLLDINDTEKKKEKQELRIYQSFGSFPTISESTRLFPVRHTLSFQFSFPIDFIFPIHFCLLLAAALCKPTLNSSQKGGPPLFLALSLLPTFSSSDNSKRKENPKEKLPKKEGGNVLRGKRLPQTVLALGPPPLRGRALHPLALRHQRRPHRLRLPRGRRHGQQRRLLPPLSGPVAEDELDAVRAAERP